MPGKTRTVIDRLLQVFFKESWEGYGDVASDLRVFQEALASDCFTPEEKARLRGIIPKTLGKIPRHILEQEELQSLIRSF